LPQIPADTPADLGRGCASFDLCVEIRNERRLVLFSQSQTISAGFAKR
jgi:hypothetical protein